MNNEFGLLICKQSIDELFEAFFIDNGIEYIKTLGRGSIKPSIWDLFNLKKDTKSIYFMNSKGKMNLLQDFIDESLKKDFGMLMTIGDNMESNNKIFICVVTSGFADEVMDIARNCGANGGTIISGRGTGIIPQKMMGFEVDSGKEIVFILCNEKNGIEMEKKIGKYINENEHISGISFMLNAQQFNSLNVGK